VHVRSKRPRQRMKSGVGLALIAVGAILAFAVHGSPSWLNLHVVGWVLMLVGVAVMALSRRTYGWLGRRMQVRRTYPGGQAPVQPYNPRNAGVQGIEAARGRRPTLVTDAEPMEDPGQPVYRPAPGAPVAGSTEVLEEYEQP
jgi:hypothetical protein